MCSVGYTILKSYPRIEKVARHVSTIGIGMSLVVCCIVETLTGAKIHIKRCAGLKLDPNISSTIRCVNGAIELDRACKSTLCGGCRAGS